MEAKKKKSPSIKLKKIANYPSRLEAEMATTILKKHGILALIKSEASGIFGSSAAPSPKGFFLLVPEKDVKKALKILPYKE